MQKVDHSGHRARMREKYLNGGLDIFAPHEILEMMLFYVIPYRNTNGIAKELISQFGSLSRVLDAPLSALREAGLTENQAIYLKLIPDITRVYYCEKYEHDEGPLDYDDLPGLISRKYIGFGDVERVLLVLCDTKGRECFCGFISEGSFKTALVSIRKIIRLAINCGAVTAFIAHNHPSGVALPSVEDLRTTRELRKALAMVQVDLVDHFIVADGECVSLQQSGILDEE